MENKNDAFTTFESSNILKTVNLVTLPDPLFLKYKVNNDILNNINKFILVIDFPNIGGGTSFFLNTIISKYKHFTTFVIVRNINGLLHININEEYDLIDKLTLNESLNFIDHYSSKITKIFINHVYLHEQIFIDQFMALCITKIGITHDYYNLIGVTQPLYHEIQHMINIHSPVRFNINNLDILITQSQCNLHTFGIKYIKNIDVVNLPDYYSSDKMINTSCNSQIIVGIIGYIHDVKGKHMLEQIINYYKSNTNITIAVIGYIQLDGFTNFQYYNSIEEFNQILIDVKPNVLLELSLWPETYSYTLTLAMLSQLPILYIEKQFDSVIAYRLNTYTKAYSFMQLHELDLLIKQHSQNYLYTIKPVLKYNDYWNKLFIL